MLFIARGSDSEDGSVPPEPAGPMEVAGCECQATEGVPMFIDGFSIRIVSGNIDRR